MPYCTPPGRRQQLRLHDKPRLGPVREILAGTISAIHGHPAKHTSGPIELRLPSRRVSNRLRFHLLTP